MIQKTFRCRRCESTNIVKNGHNASGSPQYHCKECHAYGVLEPKRASYSDAERARILHAYREHGSLREMEEDFGVSRQTILRWLENES